MIARCLVAADSLSETEPRQPTSPPLEFTDKAGRNDKHGADPWQAEVVLLSLPFAEIHVWRI
jgi:hypothetical protein